MYTNSPPYLVERARFATQFPEFAHLAAGFDTTHVADVKSPFETLKRVLNLPSKYHVRQFLKIPDVVYRVNAVGCTLSMWEERGMLHFLRRSPDYMIRDYPEYHSHLLALTIELSFSIEVLLLICQRSKIRSCSELARMLRSISDEERNFMRVLEDTLDYHQCLALFQNVSLKNLLSKRVQIQDLWTAECLKYFEGMSLPKVFPNEAAATVVRESGEVIVFKEIVTHEQITHLSHTYGYCLPYVFYRDFDDDIGMMSLNDCINNEGICSWQLLLCVNSYYEVYNNGEFVGVIAQTRRHGPLALSVFWDTSNKMTLNGFHYPGLLRNLLVDLEVRPTFDRLLERYFRQKQIAKEIELSKETFRQLLEREIITLYKL